MAKMLKGSSCLCPALRVHHKGSKSTRVRLKWTSGSRARAKASVVPDLSRRAEEYIRNSEGFEKSIGEIRIQPF